MEVIWFEVSLTSGYIEKVEVEKYNDKSVWVKAGYKYVRRSPRVSHFTEYHPTFEQARAAGRKRLLSRIKEAELVFNQMTKLLAYLDSLQVESLAEPSDYDTPPFVTSEMILGEDVDVVVTRKEPK